MRKISFASTIKGSFGAATNPVAKEQTLIDIIMELVRLPKIK
jgi:hypothetical protein